MRKNKLISVAYGTAGGVVFAVSGWFFIDLLLDKSLVSGAICWMLWVLSCWLMRQSELAGEQDGQAGARAKKYPRSGSRPSEDKDSDIA